MLQFLLNIDQTWQFHLNHLLVLALQYQGWASEYTHMLAFILFPALLEHLLALVLDCLKILGTW